MVAELDVRAHPGVRDGMVEDDHWAVVEDDLNEFRRE